MTKTNEMFYAKCPKYFWQEISHTWCPVSLYLQGLNHWRPEVNEMCYMYGTRHVIVTTFIFLSTD